MTWRLELSRGHYAPLDGLRGVAVLMVLGFHLFNFPPFWRAVGFGWAGVDLFFVLSGFLITGILIDSRAAQRRYLKFVVRRALRIFPLYYCVLGIFFFYAAWTGSQEFGYLLNHQAYFWTYTQNVLFSLNGWDGKPDALNHFWSLAIEEQFYLLWPLAVYRFTNGGVALVALAGIAMSVILRNLAMSLPVCYVLTPFRLDGLLVGAICAVVIRDRPKVVGQLCPALFLTSALLVVSCVVVAGTQKFTGEPFLRWGILVLDIFFGCLLLSLYDEGRWGKFAGALMSAAWLRWCGRHAYGIYVYHWILQCVFQAQVVRNLEQFGLARTQANCVAAILLTTIVLAVSSVSYKYFESPFLRLKVRFQ